MGNRANHALQALVAAAVEVEEGHFLPESAVNPAHEISAVVQHEARRENACRRENIGVAERGEIAL